MSRSTAILESARRARSSLRRLAAIRLIFVAACAVLLTSSAPSPACATTLTDERPFLFAFDGHDATAGSFEERGLTGIAVDNATGAVYAANGSKGEGGSGERHFISKFNTEGQAQNFFSTGSSSLFGPPGGTFLSGLTAAVDNSGGPGQGDLLVNDFGDHRIDAFDSSGTFLWFLGGFNREDVAVDHGSHPWDLPSGGIGDATEYESTGSPPRATGCTVPGSAGGEAIDLDAAGDVYVQKSGGIVKFTKTGACTYTSSTFDPNAQDVYVDQSSLAGHVFTVQSGNFEEYEASGANLGIFGAGYLLVGSKIAYNPAKDWVYVTQRYELHPVVAVFGPLTSGIAPTVTETIAAPTGTEVSTAHLAGKVNPENVPADAHFEWKRSNESWASAAARQSSPPQALTTNNTEQAVAFDTDALRGNSAYEVRLVGVNSSNHLAGFSSTPVTIATKRAAESPVATVKPVATPGTTTATVEGAVNPKGDTADWRFEIQQACEGEFVKQRLESLTQSATTPQSVFFALTGLLPSERYCARLWAENSAVGPEIQRLVVDAGTGEYTLSMGSETTAPIAWNAPASTIESRLDRLKAIEYEGVHVTGGPGDEGGTHPYTIEFRGWFVKETNVPQLVPTGLSLSGGAANATVTTIHQGTQPTRSAPQQLTTAPIPPDQVETIPAAPRLDTTAWLNASVNPEGEVLTYRFEYSEDGTTWKPVEGCRNGAGEETAQCTYAGEEREPILVAEQLADLKPNTTYSYRFSAENPANHGSPVQSAVATFTTRQATEPVSCPQNAEARAKQHSEYLARCRGIELVNSPDKGDQNVVPVIEQSGYPPPEAARDGEAALWGVSSGAPGASTATFNLFLAKRTAQTATAPSGWQSTAVVPPPTEQLGKGRFSYRLLGATPDLSRFLFKTGEIEAGFFIGEPAIVRTGLGRSEETLERISPNGRQHEGALPEASEDGAHVITMEPESGRLEDIGAPGHPEVLSIMPDGAQSACPLTQGTSWPGLGTNDGVSLSHRTGYSTIARADASRVYFQVQRPGECGTGPYGLYARDREANQTTMIDPGSHGRSPALIRVSSDGKDAYYITQSHCRRWEYKSASAPVCKEDETADENEGGDLYRWEEGTGGEGRSTCVSCQVENEKGEKLTDVEISPGSAVILSDDFSRLYFISKARLVPGRGDASARNNIYLLSGGVVRFVASPLGRLLDSTNALASSDGKVLVFSSEAGGASSRALTADEVASHCPSVLFKGQTEACNELYVYEAGTGSLECISCVHGGLTTQTWSGSHPAGRGYAPAGFALSADGSTVAFPTPEALVSQDVNAGMDIYEWHEGAVHLITDGATQFPEGESGPIVGGIDAGGANVFFAVVDPGLTGFEHDGQLNLYDARVGGGFVPPAPEEACDVLSDKCQGPVAETPLFGAPGSALLFAGNGNVSAPPKPMVAKAKARPKRCAKGWVRKRVHGKLRCVKKKKAGKARHGKFGQARRGARRRK